MVNADIKAQVFAGYLQKQEYTEGSFVKTGQLLFQIDPQPFEAVLDQAKGQLAQASGQLAQAKAQLTQAEAQVSVAEANQVRTQLDADRYVPLAKQQAITQQDLDNAVQNNLAAKAQVQSAKAQVETARAQIQAASVGTGGYRDCRSSDSQSGFHAAHIADRWHRWTSPAAGGRPGEPCRRTRYDSFDSGPDQGLFYCERARISGISPALRHAGDAGRGAEAVAPGADFGGWDGVSAHGEFISRTGR